MSSEEILSLVSSKISPLCSFLASVEMTHYNSTVTFPACNVPLQDDVTPITTYNYRDVIAYKKYFYIIVLLHHHFNSCSDTSF